MLGVLREASIDTQWPEPQDIQPRELGLSREQWDVVLAMRGLRFFPADLKAMPGEAGVWARQAPVPVVWTWWSAVLFANELRRERQLVLDTLLAGRQVMSRDPKEPCAAWNTACAWM